MPFYMVYKTMFAKHSEGLFFSVMKSWNMLGEHAFKLFTIAKKTTELDYRDVLKICNLHVRFDFPAFFESENFAITVAALEMFVNRVPNSPISTTGYTFIEIVYRVLHCRLNELFINELCKKLHMDILYSLSWYQMMV